MCFFRILKKNSKKNKFDDYEILREGRDLDKELKQQEEIYKKNINHFRRSGFYSPDSGFDYYNSNIR